MPRSSLPADERRPCSHIVRRIVYPPNSFLLGFADSVSKLQSVHRSDPVANAHSRDATAVQVNIISITLVWNHMLFELFDKIIGNMSRRTRLRALTLGL
jgi:hypothetical protein